VRTPRTPRTFVPSAISIHRGIQSIVGLVLRACACYDPRTAEEYGSLTSDGSIPGAIPEGFGPFRVLHQVGAGTLGQVFRAHDPAEGRLVAVKAFRLDLIPEKATEFATALNELAGRSLDHPSIAAPVGAGVQGTTPWLAQAYIPAESLDAALRQYGPPPLGDALAIVTALAGALDYAAAAGVLHGALHPRDVLVAPDDTRIVDLGVAAALESVGHRAPVRRPYTAPERIEGAPISRAADIFALGAIAFELITGQRVNGAGDQAAATLPEIRGANRESLVDTFAFALSPSPDERFATALGFAAALKRALGEASMHAMPVVSAPDAGALDLPGGVEAASDTDTRGPAEAPLSVSAPAREPEAEAPPMAESVNAPVETMASLTPEPLVPPKPKPRAPRAKASASRASHDGNEEPVLSAPPLRDTAAPPPAPLEDVEFRPAEPAGSPADEAPVARGVLPRPPRVRPAVPQTSFQVVSRPLLIGIFVVGAMLGVAAGWMIFGHGDAAVPQQAAAPPSVPAAAPEPRPAAPAPAVGGTSEPAPSSVESTPPSVEDGAAAEIAGPSAPGAAARVDPSPARASRADPPRPRPAAPVRGQLTVRSNPSGARVELNGRSRGRTPLTVRDLPLGAITVRVTRDGFGPEQRRVTLTANRASQALDVPLARAAAARPAASRPAGEFVGSVFVETRPAGARVFIDGRDVGNSPVSVPELKAGSHVVRLEMPGYKRWTASVSVVAGERNRVAASLEEEDVR
jgi:serine/threonine-protein kinase